MFLSKVTFPPNNPQLMVASLKGGLYDEHKLMWSLFTSNPDASRDFLYLRDDSTDRLFYYLLSRRMPETASTELQVQTKEYSPVLKNGDLLVFSLRANAVVTRKPEKHTKRRIRRDIVEAKVDFYKEKYPDQSQRPSKARVQQEAAEEWIGRQAESGGFQINSLNVANHAFHKFKKDKGSSIVTFNSLDFQGMLQVTDEKTFTEKVLYQGLGRSKAFGCGLMLIRRA